MTHIRLNIDDQTVMDGDLGDWKDTPPTAIQHLIKPGKKPQPFMQAALMALMDAILTETETTIDVHTMPTGWNVRVTQKAQIGVGQ